MTWPEGAISLPACPTEDSTECFWDATAHGNGFGDSFFEHDGITVLIQVPDGSYIESVIVDPAGIFQPYAAGAGYGVTFRERAPDLTLEPTPEPTGLTTTTAEPTEQPDALSATGLDLAPLGILVAAALAVSVIGLALIALKGRKNREDTR